MKLRKFWPVCLLITSTAFAANTGSLLLKSIVPGLNTIEVEAKPLASTLPLDVTQSNSDVAKVKIKANSTNGYKITISSANSGKLVHETVSSSNISYTLRFDSTNVNLATGAEVNYPAPQPSANNAKVEISYTGVPLSNLIEGNYTDTVTFTISSL